MFDSFYVQLRAVRLPFPLLQAGHKQAPTQLSVVVNPHPPARNQLIPVADLHVVLAPRVYYVF